MAAFTESDWSYYRVLTIANGSVPATMPDGGESGFPVDLIIDPPNSINDDTGDLATTFFDNYADTGDLCFTADPPGANTLPHGIKRVVTTNGSEYLAAAVYVPSISSSVDTTIRMYYTSALADQQQKTAVYPTADGWVGYWTLEEEQAGQTGAAIYLDWTANANNGQDYVASTGQTGLVGRGQQWERENSGERILVPAAASFDSTAEMTAMWWMYPTYVGGTDRDILTKGGHSSDSPFLFWDDQGTGKFQMLCRDDAGDKSGTFTSDTSRWINSWKHMAVTFKGAGNLRLYIDASEDANSPKAVAGVDEIRAGSDVTIGADDGGGARRFDGYLDEVSWHSSERSADWITTVVNSQLPANNNTFWTVGAETAAVAAISPEEYMAKFTDSSHKVRFRDSSTAAKFVDSSHKVRFRRVD